jgi:hypothetical protein
MATIWKIYEKIKERLPNDSWLMRKEKKKMAVKFLFVTPPTTARQHFWKRNIN